MRKVFAKHESFYFENVISNSSYIQLFTTFDLDRYNLRSLAYIFGKLRLFAISPLFEKKGPKMTCDSHSN